MILLNLRTVLVIAETAKLDTYALGMLFGSKLLFVQLPHFPSANTFLTQHMIKHSKVLPESGLAAGNQPKIISLIISHQNL